MKTSGKLQFALIQHPMWLIIKEDHLCAERTPPWGADSLDDYAARIGRNLAIVENDPLLKINYEFSSFELNDLCTRYLALYRRMKKMVAAGRLFFVNGSYSQPHGQALSLEANIRQFQYGLATVRRLFGVQVLTHACQEPDYTNQTPQLLRAFGMKFAWYGAFIHDLVTPMGCGPEPALLYRWLGLDGTEVPLVSDLDGMGINLDRREPATFRDDPDFVFIKAPDMQEFEVDPRYTYVALDQALAKQYRRRQPVVPARLQLPWSYVEGTDGETLMREIFSCERALVALETVASLADASFRASSLDEWWKKWLVAQHHDGLWHGGPELREKQRQWCREVAGFAGRSLRDLLAPPPGGAADGRDSGVCLNLTSTFPLSHSGILRVPLSSRKPPAKMHDRQGNELPVQTDDAGDGARVMLVPFAADGCVNTSFLMSGTGTEPEPEAVEKTFTYENRFYQARISAYGGLVGVSAPGGREIIRNTAQNHLDFTIAGLKKQAAMGYRRHRCLGMGWTEPDRFHYLHGMDAAGALTAMIDGRLHAFALGGYRSRIMRGPVADILVSRGWVGPIAVTRKTFLYHDLPWLEMEITCDFDCVEIDSYADDAHKLCVWWPCWYKHLITAGIPGGSETPSRPEIAFLPIHWLDIGAGGGGLAVAYEETLKHFRREGRVGTVLAWGDRQGHFSNHNMVMKWRAELDLRLRGKRTYRFRLFPHSGDWRDDNVPAWAMAFQRPPVADWVDGTAATPPIKSLHLRAPGLVPVLVTRDERLRIRFYEAHGRRTGIEEVIHGGAPAGFSLTRLDGREMAAVEPFMIGALTLDKDAQG